MATRIINRKIPTEFIRLDSTVTDPDEFLNQRDLQIARENHNILIARGIKRHVLSYAGGDLIPFYSIRPASRDTGDIVFFATLSISPYTKSLVIVMSAFRTSASAACILYPVIDAPRSLGEIDTSLNFTVTATANAAKYSAIVPVPAAAARSGWCTLNIYIAGIIYGADVYGAACTIDDVGVSHVDVDLTPAGGGTLPNQFNAMYITTDAEIAPRLITSFQIINAGNDQYRLLLDAPWERQPIPGVDTIEERATTGVVIDSLNIYEQSVSDFASDPGVF